MAVEGAERVAECDLSQSSQAESNQTHKISPLKEWNSDGPPCWAFSNPGSAYAEPTTKLNQRRN